jgi:protein required for attachment to host cells
MTWVVVADAGHADIYLRKKRFGPLERAQSLDASDARLKEHDLSSDAPGRTFDREGVGRHSYEPAHTAKEHARENFARRITRDLDAGRIADDFQHLVIVAAPALLGDIRKHLSRATHHLVSAEIDKEMTGMDLSAICAEIDRHG